MYCGYLCFDWKEKSFWDEVLKDSNQFGSVEYLKERWRSLSERCNFCVDS